jgi:hypothetical protein
MQVGHGSTMSRRDFTVASALAMLSGVVITLTGCGSSSTPTSPNGPGGGSSGDVLGVISANHGHVATITRAQLTAGNALELDIQGTATHTHTVSLSQTELGQIASALRVSKESTTTSAHSHTVAFN